MNAIPVSCFGSVVWQINPVSRSGISGFLIDLSAILFRKDLDAWVTECRCPICEGVYHLLCRAGLFQKQVTVSTAGLTPANNKR
jgi:hypothetical protein